MKVQDKDKYLTKAIELAKTKELHFIEDVFANLGISKQTFYNWGFDKIDELKNVLEQNRINVKTSLRKKWHESSNATLQIALYKLLASEKERAALSDRAIEQANQNGHSTFIKSMMDKCFKPKNKSAENEQNLVDNSN